MRNRWGILALLFSIRATMAFQFQSVAAVAPLLNGEFGVGLADIGVLIGLYFAPGIVLALAGGAVGQKFGDKTTVLAGLALMFSGGLAMTLSTTWSGQIAGRLLAGTGGVLLNVLMTKMVTDWFVGREISTAMAIFVNSWPFGLAVSLVLLPPIGTAYGWSAVYFTVMALIAIGALLLSALYRAPEIASPKTPLRMPLARHVTTAVVIAGLIWSLHNVGFAMVFSFGPSMLVERGWSIAGAGSTMSIVLWLSAISVPLGGYLADRSHRPDLVLVAGCTLFALMLIITPRTAALIPSLIALGAVSGLAAGAILSLPARVLVPGTRALGMGLFYSIYYLAMLFGTAIGGKYAAWVGSSAGAFDFGATLLVACTMLLWIFHHLGGVRLKPARLLR
jgi:MFS family permease